MEGGLLYDIVLDKREPQNISLEGDPYSSFTTGSNLSA